MTVIKVGSNYVGQTFTDEQKLVKSLNKAFIFTTRARAVGYVRKYLKGKNVNIITL